MSGEDSTPLTPEGNSDVIRIEEEGNQNVDLRDHSGEPVQFDDIEQENSEEMKVRSDYAHVAQLLSDNSNSTRNRLEEQGIDSTLMTQKIDRHKLISEVEDGIEKAALALETKISERLDAESVENFLCYIEEDPKSYNPEEAR